MVQAPNALSIVVTTVSAEEDAERLAALSLEKGLAACVQITAIRSHYRWEGKVRAEAEWRLDCKTTRTRADALMAAIAEAHPYEEPELIVLPVIEASEGYRRWVSGEVLT